MKRRDFVVTSALGAIGLQAGRVPLGGLDPLAGNRAAREPGAPVATRGNILDPDVAAALFGVDGVRYVVLREIPFDRDGDVTADSLVRRYNAELANDLGNLVNRTVSMSARYLGGADIDARRALGHFG